MKNAGAAPTAIVTGAAGFLGSALTVALARHGRGRVIAIDRRAPALALRASAPEAEWHVADIADAERLNRIFAGARGGSRGSDAPCDVLHFAAFYHFGADARPEYAETNLRGTENVLAAARAAGARRLLFASSLAALELPAGGGELEEDCPALGGSPYGRSKARGEGRRRRPAAPGKRSRVIRRGTAHAEACADFATKRNLEFPGKALRGEIPGAAGPARTGRAWVPRAYKRVP